MIDPLRCSFARYIFGDIYAHPTIFSRSTENCRMGIYVSKDVSRKTTAQWVNHDCQNQIAWSIGAILISSGQEDGGDSITVMTHRATSSAESFSSFRPTNPLMACGSCVRSMNAVLIAPGSIR